MMYIENIFICIAVPMLLSLLFIPGEARKYTFFVTTGMVGLLGACSVVHAIYNLLVSAEGNWRAFGYLFPTVMILGLFAGWKSIIKLKEEKNSFT